MNKLFLLALLFSFQFSFSQDLLSMLETDDNEIDILNKEINKIVENISQIRFTIPKNWENENKNFNKIIENLNKTKLKYNRTVDS